MRKLVMILFVLGLVNVAAATYVETFDSDNAGWQATRVNDSGTITYPAATYNSSGGNPDGYISGSLSTDAPRLYSLDAAWDTTPWGDMTGETLTVDYKIDVQLPAPWVQR